MIAKNWLKKRLTADNLDNEMERDYFARLSKMAAPNDEIWFFDNHEWAYLAGRAGYCIVRDGVVIFDLLTVLN